MMTFGALLGSLELGMIYAVLALGVFLSFRTLNMPDLTVDGSIVTGMAISAVICAGGGHPLLALLGAFAGGCLAGLLTGLLHTKLKIQAILAGILVMMASYSVNLRIMGKSSVALLRQPVVISLGNIPMALLIGVLVAAAVVAVMYWFFGTELGCAIRATGNNRKMVRAQGVNTDTMKIIGLVLSNGLVGLAGGLLAQYQGSANINMGRGAIVIGLAAVIIGDVLFARIFHNFALKLVAVVIGAVIYYVVIQIVLTLGLNSNDLKLFSALVVAVFLAVPYWKGKAFRGKAKAIPAEKEGAPHA